MTDSATALVHQAVDLASLDLQLLIDAARSARRACRRERRRQIQRAVCFVRDELLSGYSDRRAAQAIDDIARGRRLTGLPTALRDKVFAALINELKTLQDVPRFERLRQIIE